MSNVSVQSHCSRNINRDSTSSFVSIFLSLLSHELFEDLTLYWVAILKISRIFGCWKPEDIIALFWFLSPQQFVQVSSQVRINFRPHTENCRVHCIDELGLLRSDNGEFGNVCFFLDSIRLIHCVGDFDC